MDLEIVTYQPASLATSATSPLDRNPAAVYLAGQNSARGRVTQTQSLETVADLLGYDDFLNVPWAELRFQHTAAIRSKLTERKLAPATINRILCALRGTLKAAWQLGLMTAEDYQRARDLKSVTGETLPAGRELGAGEIAALMQSCENDPKPAGARDAALLAVLYSGGLRREEVTGLDLSDYNAETGALSVRHGKRNKARIAYITNGAARAMADWLNVRGLEAGPLFMPINKGGNIQRRRMTPQAVYNCLAKRGELAGVKEFSPHDLRRTFVGDLLDRGADISTVAKLAGHASVTTTARYDRRPEAAKAKAAGLLHLPYHGRKPEAV